MRNNSQNTYDAIIIGAGIGGLVCGCYLAKAGMKVLLAEQHHKPGGYCSSFKRKGYLFDSASHCFGAYRKDGIVRKVINDHSIHHKINIIKFNPSDIIYTPDYHVSFRTNIEETIESFRLSFPQEEQNLRKFFNDVTYPNPNFFSKMRNWTFNDLLNRYFNDMYLKATLSMPLLGNGGLPPSQMSAFIGSKLYSEFLIDGGYYPEGGMQTLPDALSARFQEYGGTLRLSCKVKKIIMQDNKVSGIVLDNEDLISSRYVVSGCDARQTYLQLLDISHYNYEFYNQVNNMSPSLSDFIIYLGIDKNCENLPKTGTSLWFFSHYDIDKAYVAAQCADINGFGGYLLRISEDKSTILGIIPAPYKDKSYWDDNKDEFMHAFIEKIEYQSIPNLSSHVLYKEAATPHTLYRYTLNQNGASYGWAGTPSQIAVPNMRKASFLDGLYLTSSWSTHGIGISGVFYMGHDTAKIILRKETRHNRIKELL